MDLLNKKKRDNPEHYDEKPWDGNSWEHAKRWQILQQASQMQKTGYIARDAFWINIQFQDSQLTEGVGSLDISPPFRLPNMFRVNSWRGFGSLAIPTVFSGGPKLIDPKIQRKDFPNF